MIFWLCAAAAAAVAAGEAAPALADLDELAPQLLETALACVTREYPVNPSHTHQSRADSNYTNRALHPAFYGCYDWHSAVHNVFLLTALGARYPDLPEGRAGIAAVAELLTPANIAVELEYFELRPMFERPYGWAWVMALAGELSEAAKTVPELAPANDALKPMLADIRGRFLAFMPNQTYPIRAGQHSNTAFALHLVLRYARQTGDNDVERFVRDSAIRYFSRDPPLPAFFEPSSEDFLSPTLMEALLLSRVMPPPDYARWRMTALPGFPFDLALYDSLLEPVFATDPADYKMVHLVGLNLNRAFVFKDLAAHPAAPPEEKRLFETASNSHLQAALPLVEGPDGNYGGTHWLPTFVTLVFLEI